MRWLILCFLMSLLLPSSAQESAVLRYQLFVDNKIVHLTNDTGKFATNLGHLKVYAPGRTVRAQWALVKEDGTVYGSETRDFVPQSGSYENAWKPIPETSGGYRLDQPAKPGRYWFVMMENGVPFYSEWVEVRSASDGSPYLLPEHSRLASLYFGEDGKGELEVGVTHSKENLGKKFDLALLYDGKRVAWLPGGQPTLANSDLYQKYRLLVPRQLGNGTWIYDTNVERKHMVDGNWSLEFSYDGQVVKSYPFVIKDWLLQPQGRQRDSTPAARRIVDPFYWWLDSAPEQSAPPSFTIPANNGPSWS
jgi:hypothetical protein